MIAHDDIVIQAANLRREYRLAGETVYALRGMSLDVQRGEYNSIMGPSGSGKSTLFNLLGGLDIPDGGSVYFEGEDLADAGERRLAWLRGHRIGYVFQTFNLLPAMTATANVAMPLIFAGMSSREARTRASAMLE